jgi:hypothetical protein
LVLAVGGLFVAAAVAYALVGDAERCFLRDLILRNGRG